MDWLNFVNFLRLESGRLIEKLFGNDNIDLKLNKKDKKDNKQILLNYNELSDKIKDSYINSFKNEKDNSDIDHINKNNINKREIDLEEKK